MLRFGTVSETDGKGMARVNFAADEIVSGWLHIAVTKSLDDQHAHQYDIGEHVACLMDENSEAGVILCAIYSKATEPPSELQSADVQGVVFKDGTKATFDRSSSTLLVEIATAGTVTVKVGTAEHTITRQGHTIKNTMSLKAWAEGLCDALAAETHTTPLGPTSPPINVAQYIALKGQLALIFEG
mgnify:FL=1